ncbi:hypothetical protein DPMN_175681 [Dreissena polymorpha]|uniref:Uncharacterized protein n=1 Tax=Dreissena polymorpha TaxID=45954 RepID=A0A9D4E9V2_DREPO|nr:hypothetical protein DPMN_175681 [Dreissena polymorpha]
MSFIASTPNTAVKRTISVLSTPEDQGEQKKNRVASVGVSSCEFNYTFDSMADFENPTNVVLDDNTMKAIKQTVQEAINTVLSTQMKSMIETIITGVVDGLSKRIECLELENNSLKNENGILKDRMVKIENTLDASEQYSRRNSLRIFGIPENEGPKEGTDGIVMNLCTSMGADVSQ